ncbi:TetR/AcrR family transcriptional regulator [Nesterenkonia lutea]|uniref:AcrR family transcriptional regulator n=1 Tax=Nesterenkonia lutea TaxID=272919 RepID=A0ABR9JGW6_9MICC|nr:TetR/AcrR family transcriptional regulator [Nesterenkonia lutea]MBE1525179.1 AcrR family transcriptional regulator [Nesterenkonia lutea]
MDDERVGLREIKKQMTRESIAAAALKLTLDRGLANVTIDDIAREAFVSPRTVSNYFSSKEEAVVAGGSYSASEMLADFEASPVDEPPLKALCRVLSRYARERPERMHRAARMIALEEENPGLRPFRITQQVELVEVLSVKIGARTGTDPATDLYPSMVASAAATAMVTSLMIWARAGMADEQIPLLIEDAFNLLSAGYPPHSDDPQDDTALDA